jgi:hypothetical protein
MTHELTEWATTARELEVLEALVAYGSNRKAGAALGISKSAITSTLERLRARQARTDISAHRNTEKVPPGFAVKGTTTLQDHDGKVRMQWVKTDRDAEKQAELMRATVEAMASEVRGMGKVTKPPAKVLDDILAVYPFGDPHVGLQVWAKECGEAFDLAEGRRLTLGAVDRLVAVAPPAHTAILLLLGDVFHMNDQTNQTPAHKHQLDVDSRFVKVLQVGIETYRHAILRALEKHQRLIVKLLPGNHDPQAIWTLAFTLDAYFSNEPRVTVDLSPAKHWYYTFGNVLIGSTHGDTQKPEQLPAIMACDRPEEWGKTKHRYWYTGHIHSSNSKEFPGVTWESFRTLAASDAYAMGHGYRAGRDMRCIVMHKEYGEIERLRCDIGMLQ